jgi:hypothetical protein
MPTRKAYDQAATPLPRLVPLGHRANTRAQPTREHARLRPTKNPRPHSEGAFIKAATALRLGPVTARFNLAPWLTSPIWLVFHL